MLSSFVAVDTETTGLDFEHDRVIELAAVRFEGGKPVADFTALLSPGDRSLSPVSRLITGLNDEELRAAPPLAETLRAFLGFAGDSPLVAHNAEFDAHFVRRALEAEGLPPLPGTWIDSLLLSRIAWPMWDSHRLDSLAERLNVPRDAEHRALPDARRAGYVFDAAQRFARENLSGAAWNDLARLAADLPDWRLVFFGEGGDDAGSPAAEGDRPVSTAAIVEEPDAAISSEIAAAISSTLLSESWLALETPAGADKDSDDGAAGLRGAIEAARAGQRVLLAVPDNFAWNALRKSAGTRAGSSMGERGNPRIDALAEPSGYLCRARLRGVVENPERVPLEERAALLPLVAWADRNPAGPVADGRGFSPERARVAWSRVCCDAWGDDPAARAARDSAAHAGVILVTHATLCAHAAREGALLPACDSLIVTGAHRFPETAQSPAGAGRSAALFRLRDALQLLRLSADRDAGLWIDLAPRLAEDDASAWREKWFEPDRQLQKFLQKAGRHAGKTRPQGDFRIRYTEPALLAFGADPAPVLEALRENEAFLERCAEIPAAGAGDLRRILARLRAFRADFESLCDARDADRVYWFEDAANPHKATLRAAPRDMEPFGDALRGLFGAGAFLSPALIAGGNTARDARWFLRAAGLLASEGSPDADVAVRRVSGAMNIPPRFLMAPFAPAPGSTGANDPAEEFARFLAEAAGPFAERGVLVFCPSQTALRSLHGALRKELARTPSEDVPLWAQWIDGNRDAIARLYASGRGGYVLASEGLPGLRDADGGAPALWAVTRMPLPPPRDPLLEARGETLREEGGNARLELWHPAAILRLKRDWAALCGGGGAPKAVWLLDARAAAEGLGARLAGALGCEAEIAKDTAALREMTMSMGNGQWVMGNGQTAL